MRLIKIVRLSRIGRMKVLRDMQYNGVLHPAVTQLVKLLFLYFFVLHMAACFYWCAPTPRTHAILPKTYLPKTYLPKRREIEGENSRVPTPSSPGGGVLSFDLSPLRVGRSAPRVADAASGEGRLQC